MTVSTIYATTEEDRLRLRRMARSVNKSSEIQFINVPVAVVGGKITMSAPARRNSEEARTTAPTIPGYLRRKNGESIRDYAYRVAVEECVPERLIRSLGWTIRDMRPEDPKAWNGCCDEDRREVRLYRDRDAEDVFLTTAHELAHVLGVDDENEAYFFSIHYMSTAAWQRQVRRAIGEDI